jgi:putative transcriptional regulator
MKPASGEVSFISRRVTKCALAFADLVHVTDRTIISIEKEKYNPSLMLAYRLAQVFHTTVEDLCQLAENMRLEDEENENL